MENNQHVQQEAAVKEKHTSFVFSRFFQYFLILSIVFGLGAVFSWVILSKKFPIQNKSTVNSSLKSTPQGTYGKLELNTIKDKLIYIEDNAVKIYSIRDGTSTELFKTNNPLTYIGKSFDGKYIYYNETISQGERKNKIKIYKYDLVSKTQQTLLEDSIEGYADAVMSPNELYIAYSTSSYGIKLFFPKEKSTKVLNPDCYPNQNQVGGGLGSCAGGISMSTPSSDGTKMPIVRYYEVSGNIEIINPLIGLDSIIPEESTLYTLTDTLGIAKSAWSGKDIFAQIWPINYEHYYKNELIVGKDINPYIAGTQKFFDAMNVATSYSDGIYDFAWSNDGDSVLAYAYSHSSICPDFTNLNGTIEYFFYNCRKSMGIATYNGEDHYPVYFEENTDNISDVKVFLQESNLIAQIYYKKGDKDYINKTYIFGISSSSDGGFNYSKSDIEIKSPIEDVLSM